MSPCQQKVPNLSPEQNLNLLPLTVNNLLKILLRGVIWHLLLAIGPKSISEIKPALLHIWNEIRNKCVKLCLIRFSNSRRAEFLLCVTVVNGLCLTKKQTKLFNCHLNLTIFSYYLPQNEVFLPYTKESSFKTI